MDEGEVERLRAVFAKMRDDIVAKAMEHAKGSGLVEQLGYVEVERMATDAAQNFISEMIVKAVRNLETN